MTYKAKFDNNGEYLENECKFHSFKNFKQEKYYIKNVQDKYIKKYIYIY